MSNNPYEAPRCDLDPLAASPDRFGDIVYYRSNSVRIEFRELRRLSPNWFVFLIGAVLKLLRIGVPGTFAFGAVRHDSQVTTDDFSEQVRESLRPTAEAVVACGLRFLCAYRLPAVGAVDSGAVAYVSDDGAIVAPIAHVRVWHARGASEQTVFSCNSTLKDGRVVVTVGAKHQLNSPPMFLAEHYPESSFADVLARHRERLAEFGAQVAPAASPAEQIERLREYEMRSIEYQIDRGVYVVATQRQLEAYERFAQQPAPTGPPKSTAFRGLEWLFLFTAMASLYGPLKLPKQATSMAVVAVGLLVSVAGLITIHLYRAAENRKNRRA